MSLVEWRVRAPRRSIAALEAIVLEAGATPRPGDPVGDDPAAGSTFEVRGAAVGPMPELHVVVVADGELYLAHHGGDDAPAFIGRLLLGLADRADRPAVEVEVVE